MIIFLIRLLSIESGMISSNLNHKAEQGKNITTDKHPEPTHIIKKKGNTTSSTIITTWLPHQKH